MWKKRYGGVGPSELRRLRQLEEENRKVKQIVVALSRLKFDNFVLSCLLFQPNGNVHGIESRHERNHDDRGSR